MNPAKSIHDLVAALLQEMGLGDAPAFHTILLRDRYFVGHKYHFDGGYAVWLAEENRIEVFDDEGTLLRTVASNTGGDEAAA
jgi:hypothetical protein